MTGKKEAFFNKDTSFTEAEHQLIAMKISYKAEKHVRQINLSSDNQNIIDEIEELMLREYRRALNDESIQFVEGIPQHFDTVVTQKTSKNSIIGMEIELNYKTGNHVNAITRGDRYNPDKIIVTFPGTDFSDSMDAEQTLFGANKRTIDYSEEAIQYIREVKGKYPNAQITVNGHSMAGKNVIQIGMEFPDVKVYAFNPTGLDKKYRDRLDYNKHYDNINVLIFDKEIAGLERIARYVSMGGLPMKDLPFNVHHMHDAENTLSPDNDYLHFNKLSDWIKQHSNGGFRSANGSIIDIFNLDTIDFGAGASGNKKIVFDKERYLRFADILRNEFVPNLKKAARMQEDMEDTIHSRISKIINSAEYQVEQVRFDPESAYGDPRAGRMESFKENYYRAGKYRSYDENALDELLEMNHRLCQRMTNLANMIEETAAQFEKKEEEIAQNMGRKW